jgi:uncharacterized membrane-anchored protein
VTETLKNRVPHIVLLYWIIKIASTTLGETGADMVSMTLDLGYLTTTLAFLGLFVVLLVVKLRLEGYHPVAYWAVFTSTAIAGTGLSDFLDRTLGLGYMVGSGILLGLLLAVLGLWYWRERSIQVENIIGPRAELWYWLAFLIANTLGTAAGDYVADDLGLGFATSALIIAGLLALLAGAHYYTRASKLLLFWLAFVLTRPFGATFGDLLTKPSSEGGLDLGTIGASLVFAIVLVIAVSRETQLERRRGDPLGVAAT